MKKNVSELNEAKACKWLDTIIRDAVHGTLTRRELINREMVGKTKTVQEYANKRVNLQYKKLKTPKVEYWLEMNWRGDTYSKKCPKYVFDFVVTAEL